MTKIYQKRQKVLSFPLSPETTNRIVLRRHRNLYFLNQSLLVDSTQKLSKFGAWLAKKNKSFIVAKLRQKRQFWHTSQVL